MEFESIEAFVEFLETRAVALHEAGVAGLETAAKFAEGKSKATVGHYQDAAGPFPAWEMLKDETQIIRDMWQYSIDAPLDVTGDLRAHIESFVDPSDLTAAVGVPSVIVGEHDNDDMDPHTRYRDIGEVALDHEMGLGRNAQRSFIGLPMAQHHDEILHLMTAPLAGALVGRMPVKPHEDEPPF
jgi:hypothetical protein